MGSTTMFRQAARALFSRTAAPSKRFLGAAATVGVGAATLGFSQCDAASPLMKHLQFHDSIMRSHPQVHVVTLTPQLLALHTKIRDKNCNRADFVFYANRIMRLIVEDALATLPFDGVTVTTPTQAQFEGAAFHSKLVGVSIVRAGESMEQALRDVIKDVRIGKILIQRQEDSKDKEPKLYYSKCPPDIKHRQVLLLDPMLASGGSAMCAIKVLMDQGVPEKNITFVNLVGCPEGLANLTTAYPKVKIVASFVDPCLNKDKCIMPGLGDFGDRFYGTDD